MTLCVGRWKGKYLLCPGAGWCPVRFFKALSVSLPWKGVGFLPPAWDGNLHLLLFHASIIPHPLEKDRLINILLVNICTSVEIPTVCNECLIVPGSAAVCSAGTLLAPRLM